MESSVTATPSPVSSARGFTSRNVLLLLFIIVSVMFALELTAPLDLESSNEERISAFVLDLQQTGNWLCPRDAAGKLISKPPLYVWLASLASWACGGVTPLTLRLPSVLGLFCTAVTMGLIGRKYFGATSAWLGALALVLCPAAITQFADARYDVLFTALITLAAASAFLAWERERGWVWFWIAAAGATLVKGPFGFVLAAAGLLAVFWEKRIDPTSSVRGSHWGGLLLFVLLTGGWFILAYRQFGDALIDRMITGELISHTVGSDEGPPGSGFYKPTIALATNFLPWSIFAGFGFYRIFKQPSRERGERRLERFLFCWFLVGLVLLSLSSHHRARLVFPLLPPAALLAGRELARLLGARLRFLHLVLSAAAILVIVGVFFHVFRPRRSSVRLTTEMREAARQLTLPPEPKIPLVHVDSLFSFRYYRCELQPTATVDIALEMLRQNVPVFVAVRDGARLRERLGSGIPLYELFRWPRQDPLLYVFSNQDRLETLPRVAYRLGPVGVVMDGTELIAAGWSQLEVRARQTNAYVVLQNNSATHTLMRLRFHHAQSISEGQRELAPGEQWRAAVQ